MINKVIEDWIEVNLFKIYESLQNKDVASQFAKHRLENELRRIIIIIDQGLLWQQYYTNPIRTYVPNEKWNFQVKVHLYASGYGLNALVEFLLLP